ncbi:retention module-containing protein, partial [Arsukibacterium sp.]|uniref:retention module-containing protein n=1 Tax=Arsukibacterium sp. TaxID=1977258 RepID=UPI002FD95C2A
MAQATVVQVNGEAWMLNNDDTKVVLQVGDVVTIGTEVIIADNASLMLNLEGQFYTLPSDSKLSITPEELALLQVDPDGAVFPESVTDILAVLDGEGDLLAELEDAAAGVTGGASSGHSFVQLTRISEQISPIDTQSFNALVTTAASGTAAATDTFSQGLITVAAELAADNSLTLSGSTTDVAPGSTVALTITDQFGNSVVVNALVNADGSYSLAGIDISSLVDGPLTITASAVDNNGITINANTGITLDAVDSAITVAAELAADNSLTLSGSTTDVAPGS